jgi:hypothetical protein
LSPVAVAVGFADLPQLAEVMDRLTREGTQGETCVGLIKSGGDNAAIERAKPSYAKAKAEMEGVIAELRTVLVRAGDPNSLPTVRTSLDAAGQCLKEICDAASQAVSPNTKGVLEAIANSAVETLIQTIAPRADATRPRHPGRLRPAQKRERKAEGTGRMMLNESFAVGQD